MVPAVAVLVALFLIAPILIIIPMSFSTAVSFQFPPPGYSLGYYRTFFTSHDWLNPTVRLCAAPVSRQRRCSIC